MIENKPNVTLNLKAGSHSAQMVCRGVGEVLTMFESADGKISYAGPVELYPGIVEGDMAVFHFSFVKPELKPLDPPSSIIMPKKPRLVT